MSFLLLLHPVIPVFIIRALTFFFNHLVNIPLSIMLGLGKYVAFGIALAMDVVQLAAYYNVLNNTRLGRRFHWAVSSRLFKEYHAPELMSRFHNNWSYLGIFILSMLPVYLGGLFAASFTAHLLKLEKVKSYVCIGVGSVIGCFIWTIGVWTLAETLISAIRTA